MKTETSKMSAVELKEQGNRLYASRKYDEAIGYYSKAIVSGSSKLIMLLLLGLQHDVAVILYGYL